MCVAPTLGMFFPQRHQHGTRDLVSLHDFTSPAPPFPTQSTQEAWPLPTDKLELFVFYGVILCVLVLLRAGDAYISGGGWRPRGAGEEEDEEGDMDSSDDAEGVPAGVWMPARTISKLSRAQ